MTIKSVTITTADFHQRADRLALQQLMQDYACDPMGGGVPLTDHVLQALPDLLAAYPGSFSALAWCDGDAVGLINCFESLSTFKAKPLLNIHDVVVRRQHRGLGVSRLLLGAAENEARRRGCCKLTLEVLSGNQRAQQIYSAFGFVGYELDPACGQAVFMEKSL